MDATSKVDLQQLSESMEPGTDSYLKSVMQVVNSARMASGSPPVKSRYATSLRNCGNVSSSKRCSNRSMRRKLLLPLGPT